MIHTMGGFLGIYDLQPVAAEVFSVVTFVVIINAYNLIDGIDGLAGSLTFLLTGSFAVFFAINLDWAYACLAISLCGAMGAFLIFNYPPAKIFMGDTGSLTAGLVIGCLTLHFIAEGPTSPVWSVESAPALGFALLFVPLFDTLRVFSYRIFHGVSPFTPDRNHIHHILLRFGWSHLAITGFLSGLSVAIAGIAFALQSLGNTLLLLVLISGGYLLIGIALLSYRRRKTRLVRQRFPRIVPPEEEAAVMAIATKKAN